MKKIRVGVIFGGRSGEHEVSLVSAASVIDALDTSKYDIVQIGITKEGRWITSKNALAFLRYGFDEGDIRASMLSSDPSNRGLIIFDSDKIITEKIDAVFPILHGTYGEDGTLQGILEFSGIPYVGAGVLGSSIGMDKVIQKKIFQFEGLPVVNFIDIKKNHFTDDQRQIEKRIRDEIKYPCFVKPVSLGSSVGISKVNKHSQLHSAMLHAFEFDHRVIIESSVNNARELECAVMGNHDLIASAVGEVIPSNEFYDYAAKYQDGKSEMIVPAKISEEMFHLIQKYSIKAFNSTECYGMARIDFLMERDSNKIFINEINTIPGFTSISMYPKLFGASGFQYSELLDRLIHLAFERRHDIEQQKNAYHLSNDWFKKSL